MDFPEEIGQPDEGLLEFGAHPTPAEFQDSFLDTVAVDDTTPENASQVAIDVIAKAVREDEPMSSTDPNTLLGQPPKKTTAHRKQEVPPPNMTPAKAQKAPTFKPSENGTLPGTAKAPARRPKAATKAKASPKATARAKTSSPKRGVEKAKNAKKGKTSDLSIAERVEGWKRMSKKRQADLFKKSTKTQLTRPKDLLAFASALASLGVEFEGVSFATADMDEVRGLALTVAAASGLGVFANADQEEGGEDPW